MKIVNYLLLSSLFAFIACQNRPGNNADSGVEMVTPLTVENTVFKIAFGSCNDEDKPQDIWNEIAQDSADLFVWLGDNIYGDTEDMAVLRLKYAKQNAHPEYIAFKKNTPINGTWDDHDYGANDAGKEYKMREESATAFLDFLGVDENDVRRERAGIYGLSEHKAGDLSINVYYLDTRYFRDPMKGRSGKYEPSDNGTVLGDEQWKWFSESLHSSNADINIIASSIQAIPVEHGWEKWENFPKEREKLLDLLSSPNVKTPIILSGDRHAAEISAIEWKGKNIVEITASGLTNTRPAGPDPNQYRVSNDKIEFEPNYGIIEIKTSDDQPYTVEGSIKTSFKAETITYQIK